MVRDARLVALCDASASQKGCKLNVTCGCKDGRVLSNITVDELDLYGFDVDLRMLMFNGQTKLSKIDLEHSKTNEFMKKYNYQLHLFPS